MINVLNKLRRGLKFVAVMLLLQAVFAVAVSPFLGSIGSCLPNMGPKYYYVPSTKESWWSIGSRLSFYKFDFVANPSVTFPLPSYIRSWSLGRRIDSTAFGAYEPDSRQAKTWEHLDSPPRWSILSSRLDHDEIRKTRVHRSVEYAIGFPYPCLYGRVDYHLSTQVKGNQGFYYDKKRYVWSVPIPSLFKTSNGARIPLFDDAVLPLQPILTGTLLNTLFYTLFFWALWIPSRRFWRVLSNAKQKKRYARGECIRCGYPLEGLQRCPECGSARPKKAPTWFGPIVRIAQTPVWGRQPIEKSD